MKKKNLVKILSIIFTLIALSTCVALAVSAAGTSVMLMTKPLIAEKQSHSMLHFLKV